MTAVPLVLSASGEAVMVTVWGVFQLAGSVEVEGRVFWLPVWEALKVKVSGLMVMSVSLPVFVEMVTSTLLVGFVASFT